uniref:Uncharacterized protein n=1 Tax=Craspedostauros australis TaxID=1486917 RepID=A0A7R9WLZ8_9STRA|mmetsp:Transcript_1145/g.3326  ORF Transcript_1145/g.3326 Transcript_1145/m.3326 type:complete len:105 (+) Transcript_1145:87-401(+)
MNGTMQRPAQQNQGISSPSRPFAPSIHSFGDASANAIHHVIVRLLSCNFYTSARFTCKTLTAVFFSFPPFSFLCSSTGAAAIPAVSSAKVSVIVRTIMSRLTLL